MAAQIIMKIKRIAVMIPKKAKIANTPYPFIQYPSAAYPTQSCLLLLTSEKESPSLPPQHPSRLRSSQAAATMRYALWTIQV